MTHYKRRDMLFKWLLQVTVCLHWFNPLVYLMGREINKACELSCDEAVVSELGAEKAPEYGETLLESMAAVGRYKETLASVTLSENKKLLKERLVMIVNYRKKTALTVYASVFITALLLCGFAFAGAYAAPKNSNVAGQPDIKIYKTEAWGDFSIEKIGPVTFQTGDSLQADLYWGGAGEVILLCSDKNSSGEEIIVPIQGLRGIPTPDYNKLDENTLGSMSGGIFNFKRSYTFPDKYASFLKWDEKMKTGTYWIYIMRIDSPESIAGNISRVKSNGDIEGLWVRLGRDASGQIMSAYPSGAATDAGQTNKTAKAPINPEISKPNLDMSIDTANVKVINAVDNHISVSYDPAFYNVSVVNTDGNLSVDIKNKLQNMSGAPDVTLYLPKIEYGNIKLNLELAVMSLAVTGGNITANANLSGVILELRQGFAGSVNYKSKAGTLYVYSSDKYANSKVKITNDTDIIGDISVPDVFSKSGNVYTYNNGTQKSVINVTLREFGAVVFKMGTPSRYREQESILEEPITGTNAFDIIILSLVTVALAVTLAACSNSNKLESHTQTETRPATSSSSPTSAPPLAVSPPQSSGSQSAQQPQASSQPDRTQQPIREEPITGTNEVRPYGEQPPILEEPITGTNQTRPYSPDNELVSNPDPFGLMGGGDIALFITDSASQNTWEYNYDQAVKFLSKIDYGAFTAANMKQEIVLPDIMVGEAGTEGNYIQIGMSHTNMLYVFDTQSQALIVGADGERYYDIPSKTYSNIRALCKPAI